MGTNFYLEEKQPCKCCGRPYERRHIGKSSGGWCFALHVYPEDGINNLEDWKREWNGKQIVDEYDNPVTEEQMLERICKRWGRPGHYDSKQDKDFLKRNYAEPGPNNLLRHAIDGVRIIGHGEGTWDYCVGEFC